MSYNSWLELLRSTEVIAELKERQPKKKEKKKSMPLFQAKYNPTYVILV